MPDFSVGLDNVRKKLYEDLKVGAHGVSTMLQQPMQNINSTEIGNRLGKGDIHPSSTASSL